MTNRRINMSRKAAFCPRCGGLGVRHSIGRRTLREVGVSGPVLLTVTYSKHYCEACRRHFSLPMEHLAAPKAHFTNRVRRAAVDMVLRNAMSLEEASRRMRGRYYVHVPVTTLHDWVVADLTAV